MLLPSSNLFAAAAIAWTPVNLMTEPVVSLHQVRSMQGIVGNALPVIKSASDRFDQLRLMRAGWGGPGTVVLSEAAIDRARTAAIMVKGLAPFERDPAVVPCADGSVQLEWHHRDSSFEIYFEIDGSTGAWWHDRVNSHEIEAEGPEAMSLLARWAVRDEVWPASGIAA